jgi:hypothetical protein
MKQVCHLLGSLNATKIQFPKTLSAPTIMHGSGYCTIYSSDTEKFIETGSYKQENNNIQCRKIGHVDWFRLA